MMHSRSATSSPRPRLRRLVAIAGTSLVLACNGADQCTSLAQAFCKDGSIDCDLAQAAFTKVFSNDQCTYQLKDLHRLDKDASPKARVATRLELLRQFVQSNPNLSQAETEALAATVRRLTEAGADLGDVPASAFSGQMENPNEVPGATPKK